MFEIKRNYLCLVNERLVEKQINLFHFIARAIGSTFCLCESNTKYVARLSLKAIADAYQKVIQGSIVKLSGKEIIYKDRFVALNDILPDEVLACTTMEDFKRLCISKILATKTPVEVNDIINQNQL
jgi:hypothetical protein